MIVIGLTGSIAMGKSTAAAMLADEGIPVFCSDEAVARLYNDSAVIDLIKTTFPAAYDKKTNTIDKTKLIAEIGFDHEKWDALEQILHPFVQREQQKFLREQRALGAKIVVLDIPLLFETGAENRVDYTICVSAPPFVQDQRIAERIREGRITGESYRFRLARQMPDAEKRARADFVVQTGTDKNYTRQELKKIIRDLKERHYGNGHEHRRFPPHEL